MIVTTEIDVAGELGPYHSKMKFESQGTVMAGGHMAYRVTGPRRLVVDWLMLNGYDLEAHPLVVLAKPRGSSPGTQKRAKRKGKKS